MKPRVPELDAIRGVAVLLVIMVHASDKYPTLHLQPFFRNGWMGVDLFFVLSGFLITRILVRTRHEKDYFKNFYLRRCLRTWPLYYSVLFLMFVVIPLLRPSEAATVFAARSSPWWAYPLFLQNFLVPVPTMATGPLGVTWSLAIEEQFYLVWPWMVRYWSGNQLRWFAMTVICASPFVRFYLSLHNFNIYSLLICRLDGLMAGALLALLTGPDHFIPSRWNKAAWALLLVAAPLAFVGESLNVRWIVFSFTAMSAAAFVYLAMFSTNRWLRATLTNRFLVYTGTISYGLYLLHKIPFDAAQTFHLSRFPALVLLGGVAASYGLAALSWNLLEKPCLRLKRFFSSPENVAPIVSVESA